MPRNPYYSGPIASASVAHGPAPGPSFLETAFRDGGKGLKSAIAQAFYNPEADPDFQRARHYGAQADAEQYKLERTQGADEALAGLGPTMSEYRERTLPSTSVDAVANVAAGAIMRAVSEGVKPEDATAVMRAFALSLPGDMADDVGVRVNSLLAGQYLGENQSPSLARQDFVREDEQTQQTHGWEMEDETKRRGQDIESGDRRYSSDTSAAASRYSADASAGASRYGHDLDYRASRENNTEDHDRTDRREQGSETVQTVTVDKGDKGEKPGMIARLFGAEETPARLPSKTTRTVKRPTAEGQPAAVPPPDQRVAGRNYMTPRGEMTWTGTGWVPAQ